MSSHNTGVGSLASGMGFLLTTTLSDELLHTSNSLVIVQVSVVG